MATWILFFWFTGYHSTPNTIENLIDEKECLRAANELSTVPYIKYKCMEVIKYENKKS